MNDSPKRSPIDTRPSMSMGSKIAIGIGLLLPLAFVFIYAMTNGKRSSEGSYTVVDWGVYRQLDPATNKGSRQLEALDGKKVRSLGFMVPLEDNRSEVTEFLLVPSPQACVHAPPPPSNQMVYVRMVGGPAKTIYGPIMVEGILRVTSQTHQYGTASFQIYGENAEPYKAD
jgi:uncharacterized protein